MRSVLISFVALAAFSFPAVANDTLSQGVVSEPQPLVLQPQRTNWEAKSDRIDVLPVNAEPEQNNFAANSKDPEDAKR